MQKLYLLLLLVFLFPASLLAQERTKIYLIKSERGIIDNKTKTTYIRKPVFRHDNAILTCDSAVFYEDKNIFEAFNNVHINQADTLNIYSDRLNYNGNTKVAHLTNRVKMLDQESVLTTNVLDYNMGTRIGTYVNGGKIVNKDVTLTSKNGYYFANTRDAYFRYNVVVVTPQTTIKSDTLRYNTLTNWTYFYGPTNIKGKDDNLYTENGAYNTKTEYAYFGKKNLYTSGSKSLRGDSLYYDGVAGYGKAVRNIVFLDTTDKTSMYGQLGYYYKADERTIVTKNAYVGLGTNDSLMVNNVKRPDSLWLGADTLETVMVPRHTLKLLALPVIQKDNELGEVLPDDEALGLTEAEAANEIEARKSPKQAVTDKKEPVKTDKKEGPPVVEPPKIPKDSLTKDSVIRKESNVVKDVVAPEDVVAPKEVVSSKDKAVKKKRLTRKERNALKDSIARNESLIGKDSLDRAAVKIKDLVILKTDSATLKKDSTIKVSVLPDNSKEKAVPGKDPAAVKTAVAAKKAAAKKTTIKDTVKNPVDTVKARTIKAYHNVKVYKSNLQARADSLFYTSADSTLRWFHNPILWAEGTQQTGDTIYLQLRNKKLNSVQVLENGFTVNVYKDSTNFNQIKGKLMTGFFKDGKLSRMYVDGNSESVYFSKKDNGEYDKMNRTISSRIKILFKNDEISEIVPIKDVEGTATEANEVKEEVLLTGFIWKPENRPTSKAAITNPKTPAKPKAKTTAVAKGGAKPATKTPVKTNAKTPATTAKTPVTTAKTPSKTDTAGVNLDTTKTASDSTKKVVDTVKKAVTPVPTVKK
ncbi:OstA-like protein [Pedobacter immunditicola]|uniref:OstA-like protein n=1 Tax=Pedobacter immunditicola TaxID=3133440 RepID=UPI0030966A9D